MVQGLSKRDEQVLEDVIKRLSPHFRVQRAVLFGSRSKGLAGPHSDYDVLVIADSSMPFGKRQGFALNLLWPRDYSIDLLVYTPAEYEASRSVPGSTVFWAATEGRDFYAQ